MKKTIFQLIVLFIVAGSAFAEPEASVPAQKNENASAMSAPIHFFRKYLSGADGHRCPMTPSCSRYALQAMQQHGALKGWIMTCDRLMRCGRDELRRCSTVMTPAGVRCRDTVDNNDVWRH